MPGEILHRGLGMDVESSPVLVCKLQPHTRFLHEVSGRTKHPLCENKQEWLQLQTTRSGLWDPKEVQTGQQGTVFLSTLRTEAASQTFQM